MTHHISDKHLLLWLHWDCILLCFIHPLLYLWNPPSKSHILSHIGVCVCVQVVNFVRCWCGEIMELRKIKNITTYDEINQDAFDYVQCEICGISINDGDEKVFTCTGGLSSFHIVGNERCYHCQVCFVFILFCFCFVLFLCYNCILCCCVL